MQAQSCNTRDPSWGLGAPVLRSFHRRKRHFQNGKPWLSGVSKFRHISDRPCHPVGRRLTKGCGYPKPFVLANKRKPETGFELNRLTVAAGVPRLRGSSSAFATFPVETPCTCICINAGTFTQRNPERRFSECLLRSSRSVPDRPFRPCRTRSSIRPHPHCQKPLAVAVTVVQPTRGPLALRSAQSLRHLFLKNLLKHAPEKVTNRIAPSLQFSLELRQLQTAMYPGHRAVPFCKGDGCLTNGLAMTKLP